LNRSFFRGMLTGSILGAVIGIFSMPQMKRVPETTRKVVDTTAKVQSGTKKVLKGLSKGVFEMIK